MVGAPTRDGPQRLSAVNEPGGLPHFAAEYGLPGHDEPTIGKDLEVVPEHPAARHFALERGTPTFLPNDAHTCIHQLSRFGDPATRGGDAPARSIVVLDLEGLGTKRENEPVRSFAGHHDDFPHRCPIGPLSLIRASDVHVATDRKESLVGFRVWSGDVGVDLSNWLERHRHRFTVLVVHVPRAGGPQEQRLGCGAGHLGGAPGRTSDGAECQNRRSRESGADDPARVGTGFGVLRGQHATVHSSPPFVLRTRNAAVRCPGGIASSGTWSALPSRSPRKWGERISIPAALHPS